VAERAIATVLNPPQTGEVIHRFIGFTASQAPFVEKLSTQLGTKLC
jgi:hypothetical protein